MRKALIISEQDNIAALLENDRVCEFFVNRGELLLGDIYTCTVENILPGIDAAFVNLGKDKMGFLHANDVPGQGPLKERLVPKQKLLVQITKEPTGHKGPRVSTAISLPGRFLVLVPEERGVSISRRISESRERARLKSVVNLMKPPGVGLIIRTEAKGQGEEELFEDFQQLWDTWQTIVSEAEESIGPLLIYRDQDLLYRVIRDAYSHEVSDIIVDSPDGQKRAQDFLKGWASKSTKVSFHTGEESLLVAKGVDKEIELALGDRAELPSGGHLNIQPTEALTVIDVNSGRFTSSRTQAETVRRTNVEAAQEIPRQLRLRNIGGMVIVDFIDMESRKDQQQVLEVFQRALEEDRAKPQVGQLSDLGLVELTRRRQGQSLRELFTQECSHCTGQGVMPTLSLSIQDGTRTIELPSEESDEGRPSYSRGKSGAALKSASVSQGRVVSTPLPEESEDEDEDEEDVPDDILAQVPEDLLDDREDRLRKSRQDRFDDNDTEDGEDSDELESSDDVTVVVKGESRTPRSTIYEESLSETETDSSEDERASEKLSQNITAVEEVFQEIGSAPVAQAEVISQESDADVDSHESEPEEVEVVPSYELEKSPFEAIESTVSGVFTLKSIEESNASQSSGSESDDSSDDNGDTVETLAGSSSEHSSPAPAPRVLVTPAPGQSTFYSGSSESSEEAKSTHGSDSSSTGSESARDDQHPVTVSSYRNSSESSSASADATSGQESTGYDQLKFTNFDRSESSDTDAASGAGESSGHESDD